MQFCTVFLNVRLCFPVFQPLVFNFFANFLWGFCFKFHFILLFFCSIHIFVPLLKESILVFSTFAFSLYFAELFHHLQNSVSYVILYCVLFENSFSFLADYTELSYPNISGMHQTNLNVMFILFCTIFVFSHSLVFMVSCYFQNLIFSLNLFKRFILKLVLHNVFCIFHCTMFDLKFIFINILHFISFIFL